MKKVVNNDEVMMMLERIIKNDLEKINSGELEEAERKKLIDEVIKLSDKYNDVSKNNIEQQKIDKQLEKGFVKVIEIIKASGTIVTTGMQIIAFNGALGKVAILEETGKWTTTAFRKLAFPKIFK